MGPAGPPGPTGPLGPARPPQPPNPRRPRGPRRPLGPRLDCALCAMAFADAFDVDARVAPADAVPDSPANATSPRTRATNGPWRGTDFMFCNPPLDKGVPHPDRPGREM